MSRWFREYDSDGYPEGYYAGDGADERPMSIREIEWSRDAAAYRCERLGPDRCVHCRRLKALGVSK
jgi:hypothetical protein